VILGEGVLGNSLFIWQYFSLIKKRILAKIYNQFFMTSHKSIIDENANIAKEIMKFRL
jgi:hypothetical protein